MKKTTRKCRHYQQIIFGQAARRTAKGKDRTPNARKRRARKKFRRHLRSDWNRRVRVFAPKEIDLYSRENHNKLVLWLSKIRRLAGSRIPIAIVFFNTQKITAAGGLLMLSEISRLVSAYGQYCIKATRPHALSDQKGQNSAVVEAILNQIGFYKTLGQPERDKPKPDNVSCWNVSEGLLTEGAVAGSMIEAVESIISGRVSRDLYRGTTEAVANSVEHAYSHGVLRKDGLNIDYRKWWMFVGVQGDRLIVLVGDLGVGIPNTIRKTQSENLLKKIWDKYNFFANTESDWIKTATLVRQTKTALSHRGKGGRDTRTLVEANEYSTLSIFSNKGCYKLINSRRAPNATLSESSYDHKHSILGTIVEWSIYIGT